MNIETTLEYIVDGVYLADLDVQIEWENEDFSDLEIYDYCYKQDKYVITTGKLKDQLETILASSDDIQDSLNSEHQENFPMTSDFQEHSTWGM